MGMYPYPFSVVLDHFLLWIIFINDCICILNGSPGFFFSIIVYVIQKIGGNENSPISLNIIINYHYHGEK